MLGHPGRRGLREQVAHARKYARRRVESSARRGRPAASGAHSPRHRQPAGERDGGRRAASRLPRGERRRVRALRPRSGTRKPRGAYPGLRGRAAPAAAVAHGHGARGPGRVDGRSVVGRAEGRLRMGSRRARHEGPGGGERRRHRVARARGLPARRRPRSSPPRPTRRWATASTRACSGCARSTPMRCAATTR